MARTLDPTRDEMLTHLRTLDGPTFEAFDIEAAIYWFAADWHGGQSSNLYAALSASPYRPSPLHRAPDTEEGQVLYDVLVVHFVRDLYRSAI